MIHRKIKGIFIFYMRNDIRAINILAQIHKNICYNLYTGIQPTWKTTKYQSTVDCLFVQCRCHWRKKLTSVNSTGKVIILYCTCTLYFVGFHNFEEESQKDHVIEFRDTTSSASKSDD
jgi:hypothetical protein